jgi:hypothetical protein
MEVILPLRKWPLTAPFYYASESLVVASVLQPLTGSSGGGPRTAQYEQLYKKSQCCPFRF